MAEQAAGGTQAAVSSQAGAQTSPPAPLPPGGEGGQSQGTPAPGPVPYERFAEVNTQLAEMKKWRAEQERAAAASQKATEAADAQRLVEQQKWQELAQKHEAKLKELEPVQAKAQAYEAALKKLLDEQRKGVPGYVLPLLDKMDAAEQLEWIATNAGQFQAPAAAKPAPPNINGTETGTKPAGLDEAQAAELAAIYGVSAKYLTR